MSDIKAAAERFKLAEEIGDNTVYDGDKERADVDAYALAREYLKFLDSTSLKGLSDEEQAAVCEQFGFEVVGGRWCRRIDRGGVTLLLTVEPGCFVCLLTISLGDNECEECDLAEHVSTLGQLRHLIAALGGPIEKE